MYMQYTFDLRTEQIMGRDWVILDTQRIECLNCFYVFACVYTMAMCLMHPNYNMVIVSSFV